jgi:hypothetical protein
MAVAARPPVAGNPAGLKAAMIVFVVLTVVFLGLFIWLYTQQEGLSQQAEAATKQATDANAKADEARQALGRVAMGTLAKQSDDPAEVDAALEEIKTTIFGPAGAKLNDAMKQAGIKREDALATTLKLLYKDLEQKNTRLQQVEDEFGKTKLELADATGKLKAVQEQFTVEADKIKAQLAELDRQVAANRDAWEQNLAKLRQQSQAEGERASEQLNAERKQRQTLEQQLAQNKSRIDELVTTLAKFRPSTEPTSLLQIADGSIVQTVPDQHIAYISLGSRDHIKPGMTFAVYSRVKGIPSDGKGKATLKVNNVFETTSECSVTTSNTGDPIVEGDVVANPVYDRNRKFNFAVAGDFDLNFDGKIDDPGGEQVRRMISDWGGAIQPGVDTRTDFVVLGTAPAAPILPKEGEPDEATSNAVAARKAFDKIRQDALSLGIPVLTRTQFLHFVGFGVPRNANPDAGPTG